MASVASRVAASRRALTIRGFHTYFITHLPSSSLHPDSPVSRHKLPRDASTPHTPSPGSAPAVALPNMPGRELTVVRIPLRRAKHHFGAHTSRGSRPYNEDADQAGIVEMPAFATRAPMSVEQKPGEATPADGVYGDPQVFYFALFDGHGGSQCSHFLRDELHGYIEEAAVRFGLQSSLRKKKPGRDSSQGPSCQPPSPDETTPARLERDLVADYKSSIGGYFRRFSPEYFGARAAGDDSAASIEASLTYAFLRADLDFVAAQARKPNPDDSDMPVNHDEVLGVPHVTPSGHGIGGTTRFMGGSTASIALVSTPTPAPFWHPGARSTLLVAHVGDSRILICDTASGRAQPLTSDHHPSTPTESRRLRRYGPSGSMVTGDSFGEDRIAGLANSRAFGDVGSKRLGVSAEPEIARLDLGPAQYSFLVLVSDGVSGSLSDQEIIDVVKEAPTPEQGARDIVDFAVEVSADGDNATCQVVRLGGWERRSEGGLGSLGTKEIRDARKAEAQDPRRRGHRAQSNHQQ
ncbi:protein phosphatase [Ophiocordyceps camponoti-floridani]|uniref:Protein phosphatase n=1 Tax=Ophiocordyceps camponoti-floridani TaxID=2030778 RepID=A0A8H4VC65_9HYPO|nr:protein phosphatase [Ophiocordyceps camponoti-floridani]